MSLTKMLGARSNCPPRRQIGLSCCLLQVRLMVLESRTMMRPTTRMKLRPLPGRQDAVARNSWCREILWMIVCLAL